MLHLGVSVMIPTHRVSLSARGVSSSRRSGRGTCLVHMRSHPPSISLRDQAVKITELFIVS